MKPGQLHNADDVSGECNAHLYIADNYGDGTATIRCQLVDGHEGLHQEIFYRSETPVTITWEIDERKTDCPECKYGLLFFEPEPNCHDREYKDWLKEYNAWSNKLENAPKCPTCNGNGQLNWKHPKAKKEQ